MAENSLTDYLGLPEVLELRINLSDYPEAPAAELDEVWLVVVEPAEQWGPPPGLETAVLRALAGSDDARPAVVFDHTKSAYEWGASYSTNSSSSRSRQEWCQRLHGMVSKPPVGRHTDLSRETPERNG